MKAEEIKRQHLEELRKKQKEAARTKSHSRERRSKDGLSTDGRVRVNILP
jgi:flagellar biosynthesis chaperone FliJ